MVTGATLQIILAAVRLAFGVISLFTLYRPCKRNVRVQQNGDIFVSGNRRRNISSRVTHPPPAGVTNHPLVAIEGARLEKQGKAENLHAGIDQVQALCKTANIAGAKR